MTNFNLSQYVTQLQSDDRASMTLALDHKINDNVTLFGDFMYSNTQTFSQLNGQPFSSSRPATDPYNPFNVTVTARNRLFADPRQYYNDDTAVRGVIGLRVISPATGRGKLPLTTTRSRGTYSIPG